MILVTGGTGLVGSHLLYSLLQNNDQVIAIHRKNSNKERVKDVFSYYTKNVEAFFSKITWIEADVTDICSLEEAFKNITHVYHVSALVSFHTKDRAAMHEINVQGTSNIVNLCISHGIQKLCYVSSIATLGDGVKGQMVTESSEWNIEDDHSDYAITKFHAEMEVRRGSEEGVNMVIVNPGVILGAGFWDKGSGELFTQVDKGLPFYSTGITGYVAVEDVVKAMIKLMNSDIINQRFVLVSENKSFQEVSNSIADALHKKKPSIKTTKLISEIAWRLLVFFSFFTRKPPLLNRKTAQSIHLQTKYSSQKIKDALSFTFTPIQTCIEETAARYIASK